MTTSPLPAAITDKLGATQQTVLWRATLKEVREFRAYCCNIDSDAIMGVAKEPVVFLSLAPNPVCAGIALSWDISDSYAPGSTLTSWSIDFGDVSSSSGADFPNDTTSGTHVYAAAGVYTVVVDLDEGAGNSQTSSQEVNVFDCGEGPSDSEIGELWSYISTDGNGVYFIDWAGANVWEARNTGLEGDALTVRALVMKPSSRGLSETQHELWAATLGGVYRTLDGGRSWGKVILPAPDNSVFALSPALAADDLDYYSITFDPTDENVVYVLAGKVP